MSFYIFDFNNFGQFYVFFNLLQNDGDLLATIMTSASVR